MQTTKAALYFLLFITMITSCNTTNKIPSLKTQYKEIYLEQFKLTYLRKLLSKSYNNSIAVREIIKTDHSGFTEPVLTEEDEHLIDSLTTVDNQNLITDSIAGRRRAEGAQGKRPLGYIMNKLSNKWLDSLAKQRLKQNGIPSSWTE